MAVSINLAFTAKGNSHAIWDHTVLPAEAGTRYSIATPEGCNAELTYVAWKRTGRELNPRPVNRQSNALPLSHHAKWWYVMLYVCYVMCYCVFQRYFSNEMAFYFWYLARWFIFTLCRSCSKVKVVNQRSRLELWLGLWYTFLTQTVLRVAARGEWYYN